MTASFKNYRVGRQRLVATLLRVTPGAEKDVYRSLAGKALFKCFGNYDLLVFSERDIDLHGRGIIQVSPIPCFSFEGVPLDRALKAQLLAASFLKVSPAMLEDFGGWRVLCRAVGYIVGDVPDGSDALEGQYARIPNWSRDFPTVAVVGTLGWYDLLLLMGTSTYEASLAMATILRQLGERGLGLSKGPQNRRVFESTYTLPCVNVSHSAEVHEGSPDYGSLTAPARARILVSYKATTEDTALSLIKQACAPVELSVHNTFGAYDLAVDPPGDLTVGNLLRLVLEGIRGASAQQFGGPQAVAKIARTMTVILGQTVNPKMEPITEETPSAERLKIEIKEEYIRSFGDRQSLLYNPPLYHGILRSYAAYNSSVSLLGNASPLVGMRPFLYCVSETLEKHLAEKMPVGKANALTKMLEQAVEVFSFAHAVASGGPVDSDVWGPLQSPPRGGGIQKITTAAASVPYYLLTTHLGFDWPGFVTFGYRLDSTRFHYGVLSLASDLDFDPRSWWQMFHEVGHEYAELVGLLRDAKVSGELARLGPSDAWGQMTVSEIFADTFDFVHGFRGNWPLYMRTLWKYLDGYYAAEQGFERYLLRTLFVRMYEGYAHQAGLADDERFEANFEAVWKDVGAHYGAAAYRTVESVRAFLRAQFRRFAWFLPKLIEMLPPAGRRGPQGDVDSEAEKDWLRQLREGKVLEDVADPRDIILPFLEEEPTALDHATRIAAILSLWDAALRMERDRQRYFDALFAAPQLF